MLFSTDRPARSDALSAANSHLWCHVERRRKGEWLIIHLGLYSCPTNFGFTFLRARLRQHCHIGSWWPKLVAITVPTRFRNAARPPHLYPPPLFCLYPKHIKLFSYQTATVQLMNPRTPPPPHGHPPPSAPPPLPNCLPACPATSSPVCVCVCVAI